MEVADLIPIVERLEDNVDDLEEALESLLERSLDETSKKLPLLERAKLHVLLTYSVESLIFSYLKLRGVDAKEHAIFRELTRVRQYFAKITEVESKPESTEKPRMKLDQQAATRFIKHGLAGNDKYDIERAEKLAKEKARAQIKAATLSKQSNDESSTSTPSQELSKLSTSASSSDSDAESSQAESDDSEEAEPVAQHVDNNRDTEAHKLEAAEEFIQLSTEPISDSKTAKKKTINRGKTQRKQDWTKEGKKERKIERKERKQAMKMQKSARNTREALQQAMGRDMDFDAKKENARIKKAQRRHHERKKKAKRDREKQAEKSEKTT